MQIQDNIFVAGHRGLVGSAIVRALKDAHYQNLLLYTRDELDLSDAVAVDQFFEKKRPDYVFLAAAKVGGILANETQPADFIYENLIIQLNVLNAAKRYGVKRLLFLGSSCIYPKECPQPMQESALLTGALEPTNRPYAIAKIAGIETCWAYNRQFKTNYLAVMPTNLYGPNDNYDLNTSHVIPALMRKMHEAKVANAPTCSVWGSGNPRREFLHSDDLASACLFLMNMSDPDFTAITQSSVSAPLVNIGYGKDITIAELAELIQKTVGYQGQLTFDATKPDGTMQKLLSTERLYRLGWKHRISLEEGLKATYSEFLAYHRQGVTA